MKSSKKLIALLLLLSFCFLCLFSCSNSGSIGDSDNTETDTNQNGNKQEENLQTETYKISVRVAFASDDEAVKDAIRKLNNAQGTATVIEVDKNNIRIKSDASVNEYNVSKTYTLIDGKLYHHSVVKSETQVASVREVASVTEDNRENLLISVGEGAGIGIGDFSVIESSKTPNGRYYECSGISDKSAESLEKLFAAGFEAAEATIQLDSATYKVETEKERYVSSVLSCNFTVSMNDTEYTFIMRMYYTYDYDAQISISAPSDADKYTAVSYIEIVK